RADAPRGRARVGLSAKRARPWVAANSRASRALYAGNPTPYDGKSDTAKCAPKSGLRTRVTFDARPQTSPGPRLANPAPERQGNATSETRTDRIAQTPVPSSAGVRRRPV